MSAKVYAADTKESRYEIYIQEKMLFGCLLKAAKVEWVLECILK